MARRARYDGPSDEVNVYDGEGTAYDKPIATVKRGAFLPDDVPARVRDELLAADNWTEVDYTPPRGNKKESDG
jgi:hypothetical protein